jgi:molecular chaperone HtpG
LKTSYQGVNFMAKKQFKAESKRLLDLMVNSIYTHKEIFLREIISNASDAIDKLCYISLTDDKVGLERDDFKITLTVDKDARTITVSDNGVGMTAKELESNLGVIARSGSFEFKKETADKDGEPSPIIGQFGVGFYSAFMVSDKVTVISKSYGEDAANCWVSSGADGYTVTECEKDGVGTDIVMHIKEDSEDENYSEFLEEYTLMRIIKKYSDYIRWPIMMSVTKSRQVETDEVDDSGNKKKTWEDYTEVDVVNSRVPIWQRPKSEVSDEDCAQFYKETFYDMEDPVSVIRINAEGAVSYKAMIFIPQSAPVNYYTRDFEPGLSLYSSGVMIMERCAELLPEHFRFVKGVVDSPDLSLNISRELLQHDRQLKIIATNIEKKIKAELLRLLENDFEKYLKFYRSFGIQLKYGILNGYGEKSDFLKDLLIYCSSADGAMIPVSKYIERMPEDQKYIYYACGDSVSNLEKLPQAEPVREKGYEILYMTDDVDEFVIRMLGKYGDKEFCSINADDLGLSSEEEKEDIDKQESDNQELLDFVTDSLGGKIVKAKLSHKLKSHPVCLATQGAISLEMERYFASLPEKNAQAVRAERVLELNPGHGVFESLKSAFDTDREKAAKYAELLYLQAVLTAGLAPEDPFRLSELITELMV